MLPAYLILVLIATSVAVVVSSVSVHRLLVANEAVALERSADIISSAISHEGETREGTQELSPTELKNRAEELATIAGFTVAFSIVPDLEKKITTTRAISANGGPPVDVTFIRETTVIRRQLQSTVIGFSFTGLIFFILALCAALYAVRRINRPITIMQKAAHRYARGELDFRFSIDEPLELHRLGATLNGMAGQLKERISTINRQRRESDAILGGMAEGIIVLERDMTVRTLNQAAARFLECRIEHARGRSLLRVTKSTELIELAQTVVNDSRSVARSLTISGDANAYFQVHVSPLDSEEDRESAVLFVLNDITRMKRLENMRRDFVANVSHELKTPVTSIKGFVETLIDDETIDRDKARHFLRIVLRHSGRLQAIIEDLLSLSRLEQSERDIPREPLQLVELTARVKDAVAQQAADRNITISAEYTGSGSAELNPNLIEQALVNLVDNAIKYGGDATEIVIRYENGPESLNIAVSDTGPGIPESVIPRVFERFYRIDKARSSSFGGTGLGLAIVKHIALAHGGTVDVRSTVGSGSTFSIRVPHRRSSSQHDVQKELKSSDQPTEQGSE